MKKIRLIPVLLFLFIREANFLIAQQNILLNQSAYNLYTLNPAAIGLNQELNVNCHYKKNWMGLPDSPELIQLTVDGSLSKDKQGLGLNVISEKAGMFTMTYFSGAFRYKVRLSKTHYILFGLSAGFQKQQSDFSKIKADSPEEFAHWPQQQSAMIPDAAAGLIYTYRKIIISASVYQILKQAYTYKEPLHNKAFIYQTIPAFVFVFQNTYNLKSEHWKYNPHLCIRTPQGLPIQFEIMNTVIFKDKLLMGIGYRYLYAMFLNLGFTINDKLRIVYSYEYSLGIQTSTKGGHEIGLRFGIVNSNGKTNRKYFDTDESKIDAIYEKMDRHDQQIEILSKQVDSLDKNIGALKSQINELKSKQLGQDEIKHLVENALKMNQSVSTIKNSAPPKTSNENNRVSAPGKYKMISPGSDRDYENSSDSSISNYKIVLGVYQILNYAKDYQKFLVRETKLETKLVQLTDHPKNFIYVCTVTEYTNLTEALKVLKQMRLNLKSQPIELTRGEAWILQTIMH